MTTSPNAPDLTGKLALVTGSSRGIGKAIAILLAGRGADIVLNYSSDSPPTDVQEAIEKLGRACTTVKADMGKPDQIIQMVEEVKKFAAEMAGVASKHSTGSEAQARPEPRIDILVNNAAIAPPSSPITKLRVADYDRAMDINARGPLILVQALYPYINDGGRIINIGSVSSRLQNPRGDSIYGGSKALLDFFTRAWAAEFASRNITVNAVLPGATSTDMLYEANAQHGTKEELNAMFAKQTPMGRVGDPDDVAQVVAWLSSESARWVTGQHIMASGGLGV
ncbi:uncharacterized protein EV422DRAFT_424685 [Fimicolochytrium jonesii]|uniref:uncharacterized protein n=1 Tax=Fimicolochytrium jonesii TaxID=1396493 RepID=UPI0022FE674D|nr:uncharacterized protein EV422DRAFT_424685 [Fimicolochytrium jonesii]KAI8821635.1 hypothetical protein EV422DRAFT_424685 [Fimicolochytrium jonesii]